MTEHRYPSEVVAAAVGRHALQTITVMVPIGHVAWAATGPASPAHGLPEHWPRCFACQLVDDRNIIPALAVSPDGIPLCCVHIGSQGHGSGWQFPSLEPPCAWCGDPCSSSALPAVIGNPLGGLVVGYLCTDHSVGLGAVGPDADDDTYGVTGHDFTCRGGCYGHGTHWAYPTPAYPTPAEESDG